MKKVRWGVLGVASIAVKVIPAMQRGESAKSPPSRRATAPRPKRRRASWAFPRPMARMRRCSPIPRSKPSTIRCPTTCTCRGPSAPPRPASTCCAKSPSAMNAAETLELIAARDRTGVTSAKPSWCRRTRNGCARWNWCAAAASARCAPPWARSAISSWTPTTSATSAEYGGGGLMDIGCYPIKTSRMVFGEEPVRVGGRHGARSGVRHIDILTSAILEYPSGHCVFTCGTQVVPHQSMRILRHHGPHRARRFRSTPLPSGTSRIRIDDGRDLYRRRLVTVEEFPPCDQYTIQGDLFSRAIREGGPPPVPLEDSLQEHGGDRRRVQVGGNRTQGTSGRFAARGASLKGA